MTQAGTPTSDELAAQRKRLRSLEACEEKLRELRDRESDLEVDHMAEEAALRSATARLEPAIDPALAARIGRALERRRELEEGAGDGSVPGRSSDSGDGVDALRAGRAALELWLDDAGEKKSRVSMAAKVTLLVATVVSIWAAIAVHPAFLVLLLVVIGPVSFAMGRGQDKDWRRVGARRRYEMSGLSGIPDWSEDTVRARMQELDELLAASGGADIHGPAGARRRDAIVAEDEAVRIAEADAAVAASLADAGLSADDIRGETGEWLRLVARADRSRRALEQVRSERSRVKSDAAELRDQLQQYLHGLGTKPTDQPDTSAEIAARLDRLSR